MVHYGDTHGYDKDKLRPNAWPYRDYVVRALNEDKPYRQFVEEQLAGDIPHAGIRGHRHVRRAHAEAKTAARGATGELSCPW